MHTIDTEHGPALVWWDSTSDPGNPGWVLRYHLEPEDSPDALGRRNLDQPLYVDAGPDGIADAEREALRFFVREGVGAGRRLTSAQAAPVAGLKDAASWRAARWRPEPDDHHDARTPWWWETTVLRTIASRPGQGARTDLR